MIKILFICHGMGRDGRLAQIFENKGIRERKKHIV